MCVGHRFLSNASGNYQMCSFCHRSWESTSAICVWEAQPQSVL